MTLTILSALLGILSSVIPNLIRDFERKQEIKFEVELIRIKTEAALQGIQIESAIAADKAFVEEGADIRAYDLRLDGGQFINTLRASVRPVVTYIFFFIFLMVKLAVAIVIIKQGGLNMNNMHTFSNVILDESTVAIFGTILGFWFGNRAFSKLEDVTTTKYTVSDSSEKESKRRK